MFKKLFVFLILILFISQISFVTANDNTTNILNKNTDIIDQKAPINTSDIIEKNFESNNDSTISDDYNYLYFDDNSSYYCYFGDEILIHIDSLEDGNLEVLIDNEYYGSWNFTTTDETICIPTYNPEQLHDNSKTNIGIGIHDIKLIFNFNSMDTYYALVDYHYIDVGEDTRYSLNTLNFRIVNGNSYNAITNTFEWNSKLHVQNDPPKIDFNSLKFNVYEDIAFFSIFVHHNDYYFGTDTGNYSIGIIVSNKTGTIYKKNITLTEYPNTHYLFFTFFNITNAGIYNFTAVNLIDGSNSSVLFEIIKYAPKYNMNYSINGSTFILDFEQTFIDGVALCYNDFIICVDNITKKIPNRWWDEVVFDNLSPGVHVLTFYCPEDGFKESFFYSMTFEINGTGNTSDNNESIPIKEDNITDNNNNITNNTINSTNVVGQGNSTGSVGNTSNGGNSYPKKDHDGGNLNSKKATKTRQDDTQKLTAGGNNIISDSSDASNSKTYEIQEKSASKSIDNLLTKITLILIIFVSFMIGYFRYKRKRI